MPKRKKPRSPAKPRRARGTGSVMPDRRRGGWLARVPVGRLPSGRTRYVEVRAPTQAEVVAKMRAVQPPDPNTVTVAEWAERWLAGLSVRPSTREGYERQVAVRIVPALGRVRVRDLAVSQVRAALAGWAAAGTATANRTLDVGANLFAAAVLDRIATHNPFAECPRLAHEPKPIDPFAPDELRRIVAAHDLYRCGPLLALLAGTGARLGEAAALDVADYDPGAGTVRIARTWTQRHGAGPPKSRLSRRTIVVPGPVRPALAAAAAGRTSGPLFASASGRRYNHSQVFVTFGRLLARLGLRPRGPHQMRHGVATALISAGVPIGDVAAYLGHTPAQIVRTYLHPSGADVAAALGRFLGPFLGP